jgi:hypothetical protein
MESVFHSSFVNSITLAETLEAVVQSDDPNPGGGNPSGNDASAGSDENTGTLVLDTTYAPQNIKYPQDVNLLNEARKILRKW